MVAILPQFDSSFVAILAIHASILFLYIKSVLLDAFAPRISVPDKLLSSTTKNFMSKIHIDLELAACLSEKSSSSPSYYSFYITFKKFTAKNALIQQNYFFQEGPQGLSEKYLHITAFTSHIFEII
jgi:hypothetical protein